MDLRQRVLIVLVATCGARGALGQSNATEPGFLEHDAVTPPLLFREVWQPPPHTGPLNDENRRITPQALTNPNLELNLYGPDAANIQVTSHNGVPDLWNGFTTSPVALTLKHKDSYLDLTAPRAAPTCHGSRCTRRRASAETV